MNEQLFALCLAGPTGSGKTEAAICLALAINGEVVNTDSRQVYKDFPIITAQPSCAERSICPHHLYGFLETEHKLSVGQWSDKALDVAQDIIARGKIPIFVGGTGLYFKTILEGIANIDPIDKLITAELIRRSEHEGLTVLYGELLQIDEVYAKRIHPHDTQRIIRALEVYFGTGKNFTWWHENSKPEPMLKGLYMGVDMTLDSLTPRLGARISSMLEQGALDEAKAAYKKCNKKAAPAWSSIGCAELYSYICEGLSLDDTLELWRKNTRAYAKRQLTWFRAAKTMQWFNHKDIQGMVESSKKFLNSL